MHKFNFTFNKIEGYYKSAIEEGYDIIRCCDYVANKKKLSKKTIVNRVDIDFSVKKTKQLAIIFNQLNIKASFFIRLHAPEYNPFSFENYNIIKFIIDSGHEIGYHSEIIDQSAIWDEPAKQCLLRDIKVMESMFDTEIKGIASHGGMTGLNNLDFWKENKPLDFGLLYEAYDTEPEFNLYNESFYLSDSNWTIWKCYNKGKVVENDNRTPDEHFKNNHPLIYFLIHPDTYYCNHFYE